MNTYKKDFFLSIMKYIKNDIPLIELMNIYHIFLQNINISYEDINSLAENKNNQKGYFNNGIFLEYILVPKEKMLIVDRYFKSTNNIYNGQIVINNQIYYKFFTFKIVRDNLQHEELIFTTNEDFHTLNIHKPTHIRIGKIKYLNTEEIINGLKCKLIEEGHELLTSYNYDNLLEEIGDLHSILLKLNELNT